MKHLPGLGRQSEWRLVEVGLVRGDAVNVRMRAPTTLAVKISVNRIASLADGFVSAQVRLLVFDVAPQPLDGDLIAPGTLAILADGDSVVGHHAEKGLSGKLRALVRVVATRPLALR